MRVITLLSIFSLALVLATANPIVKRATDEDISPLNEVYVFQSEEDPALSDDGEHGDREKRKIGVIKLGVSNGIINFVFGKLDAFLDAKTRAIAVLDEGNKAKNAAFGIDNTQSATSQFIGNLISQKIQAGTSSIGPLINSATTFISGASSGLTGAFASKLAPLSSIAGGLSGGTGETTDIGPEHRSVDGSSGGTSGGSGGSGNILGSLISGIAGGSGGLGSLSGGSTGGDDDSSSSSGSSSAGAGAGINLGAFANVGGGDSISTTTEDIPEFDRTRVSLEIPSPAFGTSFTLITSISKILNSIILNSAHRTQSVLEVFKPFFRGAFAIKGLPSDRQENSI